MTPEGRVVPGRWRHVRIVVVALVLLVATLGVFLPPAPTAIPAAAWAGNTATVRGAYHIHSNRSDGAGSLDAIAEAASQAGLQFVIVTDHGNGTQVPEPPVYRHGVLCLDAVELNTGEGHYVALGLGAAPYPLAGTAESVVEDVARLGGFGFVAHADSARESLQWRAWDVSFDGLEWLNADSEWRDEPTSALARAVLTYWARPAAALTAILDRPNDLIARWERLIATRRVPVIAGADAHARLGVQQSTDPDTSGWYLPMPTYRASFSVFSNHVLLDRPLSGDPADDASRLLTAVRAGRIFTVIDGLAGPGSFEFTATSGGRTANIGDDLVLVDSATLQSRTAAPAGASIALLKDGTAVKQTTDAALSFDVSTQGAYRVEVLLPGRSLPWIVSNPIYIGFDRHVSPPTVPAATVAQVAVSLAEASSEISSGSQTELAVGRSIDWRYRLVGGIPAGQYAAVRVPARAVSGHTRVRFDVGADRPMRLWVQLRRPEGAGERWGRTVYADQVDRAIDLALDTFAPIGVTSTLKAPLEQVDSLLFVVDTVNSLPGSNGRVRLSNIVFAH